MLLPVLKLFRETKAIGHADRYLCTSLSRSFLFAGSDSKITICARAAEVPQPGAVVSYSITGIENSPPSLMPEGQRDVTVFVRV